MGTKGEFEEIYNKPMKRMKPLLNSIISISLCLSAMAEGKPPTPSEGEVIGHSLKVTARVIDEEGQPMGGIPVEIVIDNPHGRKRAPGPLSGRTDKDGKYTYEGMGNNFATIIAAKEGYYGSALGKDFSEAREEEVQKTNRYRPWDPTIDIVLKKIGKPIPMVVILGDSSSDYAKFAPEVGKDLGFDLRQYDWIHPYGKGKTADFTFRFESDLQDTENYTVKVSLRFAHPDDGVIPIFSLHGVESLLKYPREAPLAGYSNAPRQWELTMKGGNAISPAPPSDNLPKPPLGYYFRIRTERNAAGKMISGLYGKIVLNQPYSNDTHDPIQIIPHGYVASGVYSKMPGFLLSYYLNPAANDRNLEYDQHNNLAPGVDKGLTWPP